MGEVGGARGALRFWFQAGTEDETEDRDDDGVIDAIQDTTELIDELTARGWKSGGQMIYREVAGGRHEPSTWAAVFAEFARFAFA
jgi:S-formylglutathione hydrolase FrmB